MPPQVERRELTDKEKATADRVRALWLEKKHRDKVTQADAAKACGWATATFGQYMNKRIPLNPTAISKFAKYLGCSPYDIDPSLASQFVSPPSDLVSVEEQLNTMGSDELRRLIGDLSRRLPQRDLLRLVALLTDRLIERD